MNPLIEALLNSAKVAALAVVPAPVLAVVAPFLNLITPEMLGEAVADCIKAGDWVRAKAIFAACQILNYKTASPEPSNATDTTAHIDGVRGDQLATSEPSAVTVGDVLGPVGQDASKAPAYPGGVQPGPGEGNTTAQDIAAIHGGP